MSRRKKLPKLFFHRGTGYWCAWIDGRRRYLSRDQTTAAAKYAKLLEDMDVAPQARDVGQVATVNEVIVAYVQWAGSVKYVKRGSPTAEMDRIQGACKFLRRLHGTAFVRQFDEFGLESVQDAMVKAGLARREINARVACIKRMFKWAARRRLIPAAIAGQLMLVDGLRKGSGRGRERAPVKPVDDEMIESTLPFLNPTVAAMVRLQRLTGMRPGEVCHIRPMDVDQTQSGVWIYTVADEWNKLAHFGIPQRVLIGKKAQAILTPFLDRPPAAYCFQPGRVQPSYNRRTYAKAIWRAIERVRRDWHPPLPWLEYWSPNQLRHAAATEFRRVAGLDAAQVLLRHSSRSTTERYAAPDQKAAIEAIKKIG